MARISANIDFTKYDKYLIQLQNVRQSTFPGSAVDAMMLTVLGAASLFVFEVELSMENSLSQSTLWRILIPRIPHLAPILEAQTPSLTSSRNQEIPGPVSFRRQT